MDSERTVNVRQRVANLNPQSPLSSWKSALDSMIDAVRSESLETGVAESDEARQQRRIAINEAKEKLMSLLIDPQEAYVYWLEEEKSPKYEEG